MRKIKDKYILTTMFIVLGVLVVSGIYIMKTDKNIYRYEKESKNYDIDITYEQIDIPELDLVIKENIELEKQEFLEEAKKLEKDSEIKYDLIINGSVKEYNDIYFYDVFVNSFTGGHDYNRKYMSYIFNNKSKKFTVIKDFLENDKNFTDLSLITKHLLNIYTKENKISVKKKTINNITKPLEKNYEHFYINKEGLNIIIEPDKVSSKQSEEIKITIPWSKVNRLLKDEYKKEKKPITRKTRDISNYKNKKIIAFTFDDGPNTATTKVLLDNLDKYDAKVTFFVLGSRVDSNKDIIKRAYQDGNDIASHTYSHKDLTMLKDKELNKEIDKTNKKIKKVIGVEPIYLRPPYGNINDHIRNSTIMHTICWNIDSLDWKTKNRKKIKKEIVNHARDGAIVLLHDIYEESVQGALLAMKELKKQGYNFVTITEMAELKNVTLDYDKTYYGF